MDRVPKVWRLAPHDLTAVEKIARESRLSPMLCQLLVNRGICDLSTIRTFIEIPLTGLLAPELLPGADDAANRIWSAVQSRRRICIYGDYDADGVTGTAILVQVITLLGGAVDFYVPNRLEEGYGLNVEALQELVKSGIEVVVTVDCGIASITEAAEAKRLGLELIITDHHEFKSSLPDAACRVHPRLPNSDYPFGGLSGSGVAFKLAWLVATKASGGPKVEGRIREVLLDCVALAAIGLIADVMPLQSENRILVKHGLHRLKQRPTPGLLALMTASGLQDTASIRAEDIAFKIAPRINVAGRLGCARMVVDLLTTPSEARARDLANYLESQNSKRQSMERDILHQAKEVLAAGEWAGQAAIVLANSGWHPGVIGIVAGRLAEQYGRPTLMIALTPNSATGSGRSIPGFALHEALAECDSVLIAHGGHAAAAGFRLLPDAVDQFRKRFLDVAARRFPEGPPPPILNLEAEVPLSVLTQRVVRELDHLEPYGCSNPRPRFLASGLQVVGEPRKIGGGERHLSFFVQQGGTKLRAVSWGAAERLSELMSDGGKICAAFVPKINEWNGYTSVQLEIVDFQPGPMAKLQ